MKTTIKDLLDFSNELEKLAFAVKEKPLVKNSYQITEILRLSMGIKSKLHNQRSISDSVLANTKEMVEEDLNKSKEHILFVMDYLNGEISENTFESTIYLKDIYHNIEKAEKATNPIKSINDFLLRVEENIVASRKYFAEDRKYFAFETFFNDLNTAFNEGLFIKDKNKERPSEAIKDFLQEYESCELSSSNLLKMYELGKKLSVVTVEDLINHSGNSSMNSHEKNLKEVYEKPFEERFKVLKIEKEGIYYSKINLFDGENKQLIINKFDFEKKVWKSDYKENIIDFLSKKTEGLLLDAINTDDLAKVISFVDSCISKEENNQNYLTPSILKGSISYIKEDSIKEYLLKVATNEDLYLSDNVEDDKNSLVRKIRN